MEICRFLPINRRDLNVCYPGSTVPFPASAPERLPPSEADDYRLDAGSDFLVQTGKIAAEGLLSACLQHEIDHLDGVLFVDHLSALKRNIILRKMVKAHKAQAESAM